MTNKELGNKIRKALKEAGFASKDVSVRVKDCGYSTSVDLTIKNPLIRYTEVEEVAERFNSYERDEKTGEILEGGNTYIFLGYENGLLAEVAEPLLETAQMVLSSGKYDGRIIAKNGANSVSLCKYDKNEWTISETDGSTGTYKPTYWIRCAYDLAVAMWRFENIGTIYA